MPLPDAHFVAQFPVQEYIVDKDTGAPLSGGIVTYYKDSNRTVKKAIYQQVQEPDNTYSFVEVANPIVLTSVGTFADDNGSDIIPFLFPYKGTPDNPGEIELYYITVESNDGVPQFTREAWPPNIGDGAVPVTDFQATTNELLNPQFVEVLFEPSIGSSSYSFSVSGSAETEIAPDWVVVTTGAGSFTVSQTAISDANVPSNPPYVLDITSSGLDSISLRQRLEASPRLLFGSFINGYFIARSVSPSSTVNITMTYEPSDGAADSYTVVTGTTLATNDFSEFTGTVATNGTGSTASAPSGYVDIVIEWGPNQHIQLSSIQLVGVKTEDDSVQFLQQSTQAQVAELFGYYKPLLDYKPIPSYLVGWDFPFNPAQPLGPTVAAAATGANKSRYIWDQTIAFQSVDNSLSFARNSSTNGFSVAAASASSFAIIQYLPATQAREILSQRNAVKLEAFIADATSSTTLNGTVTLWWTDDASLPAITSPTYNSLVTAVSASGVVTAANGTWNKVSRDSLGDAHFTLTTTTQSFDFSQWDGTDGSGKTTATFFAIVIAFGTMAATTTATINYCSLVGGDIPTRPAPKTPDEVLRECQYFYETSYDIGTVPGTATNASIITKYQSAYEVNAGASPDVVQASPFDIEYKVNKRAAPSVATSTITFYSGTSTTDNRIQGYINQGGSIFGTQVASNNWSVLSSSAGTKSISFFPASAFTVATRANAGAVPTGFITFHYIADARLGVI